MGLHAEFVLTVPRPKNLGIAKMISDLTGADKKYSGINLNSYYSNNILEVSFNSSYILGFDFDTTIKHIVKMLNKLGESGFYIEVKRNWYL